MECWSNLTSSLAPRHSKTQLLKQEVLQRVLEGGPFFFGLPRGTTEELEMGLDYYQILRRDDLVILGPSFFGGDVGALPRGFCEASQASQSP